MAGYVDDITMKWRAHCTKQKASECYPEGFCLFFMQLDDIRGLLEMTNNENGEIITKKNVQL